MNFYYELDKETVEYSSFLQRYALLCSRIKCHRTARKKRHFYAIGLDRIIVIMYLDFREVITEPAQVPSSLVKRLPVSLKKRSRRRNSAL